MTAVSSAIQRYKIPGDFWGGFASMLVALPSSVAFGVTVYSAISPHYAVFGALAGILGATALGLIAPTFGGTDRLISAPCAPAAAVLSAFAIEVVHQGTEPSTIVLLLTVMGILTGLIQMFIGFLGAGRLIKYIPYTVVSGYLSGVGLIIVGSQVSRFSFGAFERVMFSVTCSSTRALSALLLLIVPDGDSALRNSAVVWGSLRISSKARRASGLQAETGR